MRPRLGAGMRPRPPMRCSVSVPHAEAMLLAAMPVQGAHGSMLECGFNCQKRGFLDEQRTASLLTLAPHGEQPGEWAAQQALDALTGSLPHPAATVWYHGSPQLVPALVQCSQLQAITSLHLTGRDSITLQGHTLPALRTLLARSSRGEHLDLSLVSAHLPRLEELLFTGQGCSLSIEGSELPRLTALQTKTHTFIRDPTLSGFYEALHSSCGSITVSASALPALQCLSLRCDHLRLAGAQLPALTALQLTADLRGSLEVEGAELPALQTLAAEGCAAISLAGAALPSLHTLELLGINAESIVVFGGASLPALCNVALGGESDYGPHDAPPVGVMTWLAGLPTLTSLTLDRMALPADMPDAPRE